MHDSGSLQSQKPISDMPPVQQRRNEVRWRPGQEASLASSCSKQVFRKQMYCIEESTCDTVGIFGAPRSRSDSAPGQLCPFLPLVTPLQCNPWFRGRSAWYQGLNEVRWRPEQEATLAPSYLNQRSYGSKFTALKEVFVTLLEIFGAPAVIRPPHSDFGARGIAPSLHPLVTPLNGVLVMVT